jgi:hypothetical protein
MRIQGGSNRQAMKVEKCSPGTSSSQRQKKINGKHEIFPELHLTIPGENGER